MFRGKLFEFISRHLIIPHFPMENDDIITEADASAIVDPIVEETIEATPPSAVKTPFDKGVTTTEDILAHKPVPVSTGKNAGTIQYIITTKSGKEIWNATPPQANETQVSFGLTEKGFTNFIGYSSFASLSVEQRFAKASTLARQNAVASSSLLEDSKCPEALVHLLQVNIKDLL